MKNSQLSVRLYGDAIGVLEQAPHGKMVFSYNDSVSQSLSLGMPLSQQVYHTVECEAFFGGLLPENEEVKKLIGKRYGVSYNNSFALLKAIGHDCAGAISFHEMDEPILPQRLFPLTGEVISEKDLYTHIRALPRHPLFLGLNDLRLSLAGVYDKAAVCLINGEIAIPTAGCPTTHILKPEISTLENIVENEYFCLKIAAHMGLNVPTVEIRHIKDISFLLIERYDRQIHDQQIERIHQEDFCQALGIVSSRKYQNEGGPGFKACFELLENTLRPAIDRNKLASALVFNFLIGNMDAHAKNFSLLHQSASVVQIAPFYDIVCTRAYPEFTNKMAMRIGSQYEENKVLPRHWEQLCKDIQYSYPALKQLIRKQADLILAAVEIEKNQLAQIQHKKPIIDKIILGIEKRITKTIKRFESS